MGAACSDLGARMLTVQESMQGFGGTDVDGAGINAGGDSRLRRNGWKLDQVLVSSIDSKRVAKSELTKL